jgi:hypothetical protein
MSRRQAGIGDSDDEKKGVDNGPCGSFRAMDDYPTRCANCGYTSGAHR